MNELLARAVVALEGLNDKLGQVMDRLEVTGGGNNDNDM